MQRLLVALAAFGAFSFAQGQAAPKGKFLPIFFDDWWNIDYVKSGCYAKPCTDKPEDTVREFENELELAFASERACHGLVLLHFTPEMAKSAAKNPAAPATGVMLTAATEHWALMLDLDGHSHTQAGQGWSLVDPANRVLNGPITTPQRVVQQLCKIAKGVGGKPKDKVGR